MKKFVMIAVLALVGFVGCDVKDVKVTANVVTPMTKSERVEKAIADTRACAYRLSPQLNTEPSPKWEKAMKNRLNLRQWQLGVRRGAQTVTSRLDKDGKAVAWAVVEDARTNDETLKGLLSKGTENASELEKSSILEAWTIMMSSKEARQLYCSELQKLFAE